MAFLHCFLVRELTYPFPLNLIADSPLLLGTKVCLVSFLFSAIFGGTTIELLFSGLYDLYSINTREQENKSKGIKTYRVKKYVEYREGIVD